MQSQEKIKTKLNILFLAPRYHTNQKSVVKTLLDKGHNINFHVKFFGKIENYEYLKPTKYEESIISKILKKIFFRAKDINIFYFPKIIGYFFYLKKLNIDVTIIRVHGKFYTYALALLLKFIIKSKIIFYEQANSNLKHLKKRNLITLLRLLEFKLRLFIFSAIWITPLHSRKNYLPKNCYYLPFVIEKKLFQKKRSKNLRILIIGKFQNRKNHLLAAKSLLQLVLNHSLFINFVGEVSNQEHLKNYNSLKNFIISNNLSDKMKVSINVKNKDIDKYYLNNDIFLLPSYNEPASISILEAISFGLPVICHKTCGTKTYIKNNYNGFVLNEISKKSIQEVLMPLLHDSKYLEKISNNCLISHNKNFSTDIYYDKFTHIMRHFNFNLEQ